MRYNISKAVSTIGPLSLNVRLIRDDRIMLATELSEAELSKHLHDLLQKAEFTNIHTEVQIGHYRLDAVATDNDGSLVVVELKVVRTKDTLAQLLLYPHAVRKRIMGRSNTPPCVRALLITTHLDQNVVEIVDDLGLNPNITIRVCVGDTTHGLKLVAPCDPVARDQVLDQGLGASNLDEIYPENHESA